MLQDEGVPGLERRKAADGSTRCYWRATKPARRKGYKPDLVRLVGDWDKIEDRPDIIARCKVLQSEMREWMADGPQPSIAATGTIAWLCDIFQTHPDSPYLDRRADTRRFYDTNVRIIRIEVGARRIDSLSGIDIRRWYKAWSRDGTTPRRGKACIQTLRRIVKFGSELRDKPTIELATILGFMRFPTVQRRKVFMTRAQNTAARTAARELGRPSIARALALQFGTMLRQKDVIGEWIVEGGKRRWQMGLVWGDHLSRSLSIKKPTSKSNGRVIVEHDLLTMPDVAQEFDDVSIDQRVGPVIIDEKTHLPYKATQFRHLCRAIFRKAEIPDNIWNMDARAGAITEALDSGATIADTAKVAGQTQESTTEGYHRGHIEQSIRVARLRAVKKD